MLYVEEDLSGVAKAVFDQWRPRSRISITSIYTWQMHG
jgi:hypothetical protein